jgi:uncharacterized protein (TIGR03000 family)
VNLPADATLTIDGAPTSSRTDRRVFVTPALEEGREYAYTLKGEVVRDGQRVALSREVRVRAGTETQATLELPSHLVAAK